MFRFYLPHPGYNSKRVERLGIFFHIIYCEDLMIVSEIEEQNLERLDTVLEVLTKAGFSLNLEKRSILKTHVHFLGYEVEAGEIRPNKKQVEALAVLPPTETYTQLRQFIRLASYFRQFVSNFSQLMTPLHRLTSGKCPFEWKSRHEEIRQQVISVLTTDLRSIFSSGAA